VSLLDFIKDPFQGGVEKIVSRLLWPSTSVSVVAVHNGRLLTVTTGSTYMLPGGVVEPGERLHEAAERETLEETGLEVRVRERIYEIRQQGRGPVQVYRADVTGGSLSGSSEGSPELVDLSDVDLLDWRFDQDIPRMLRETDVAGVQKRT